MRKTEEQKQRRDELKNRFRWAYQRVSEILFAEDPIGISFESNRDEYEPEVGAILPRLRTCKGVEDVRKVVHEEFVKWFGASAAGASEKYRKIARRIWEEVMPGLMR